MSVLECLIAIDQGTTSSRAIAFDVDGGIVAVSQQEFTQHYPRPGWVEHDPEEIWATTVATLREVLARLKSENRQAAAIGITNQRETTVIWERKSGKPVHNAIVWQDRRTADSCAALKKKGLEPLIAEKTGLLLDPYFSATKIAWILDRKPELRAAAERGELAFGTIESFLLWRLTGGLHASDATNASRTMLYGIETGNWDQELLEIFGVPRALLPEVADNCGSYGVTDAALFGRAIPITAMIGDQQAAAIGQGCIAPGTVKSTYGTGCFVLQNTGSEIVRSRHRLLSTVAYRLAGQSSYAIEGSIFVAGAAIQWLRDGLRLFGKAEETEEMARRAEERSDVIMVPAFTGLGAPHWDAAARGAIFGLTRDTGPEELVRAALEAVAYQTHDLLEAAAKDAHFPLGTIRVDGGMTRNGWFVQFLADVLDTEVDRPQVVETTAFGAAFLAGLGAGIYDGLGDVSSVWRLDQRFEPAMRAAERKARLAGWQRAVSKVLS